MRGVVVFAVGMLLVGCSNKRSFYDFYSTTGAGGASSTTTGEAGSGGEIFTGSNSDLACDGECHLWKSVLFEDLAMFWIGQGDAPPCPVSAPVPGATLHADPQPSPMICPACSCSSSGCEVPQQMHVSAGKCPAIGAFSMPWDSPGWDGDCTSDGALSSGLSCLGVPCVQSITIDAPTAAPCEPVSAGAEVRPDPVWGTTAQECIMGPLTGDGCGGSEACVPPPPDGFSLCLYRWGDDLGPESCPAEYPRHLVLFAEHDDTRACDPCECTAPQGGECAALVSLYTNGVCGSLLGSFPVTSAGPSCFDLPSGVGLGSKSAALTNNNAGSCTTSGGPVGEVVPAVPLTLCCQKEAAPAE